MTIIERDTLTHYLLTTLMIFIKSLLLNTDDYGFEWRDDLKEIEKGEKRWEKRRKKRCNENVSTETKIN